MSDWRPSAAPATLRARARLLTDIRRFLADRGVLEVDTPTLASAGATDPHLHSLRAGEGYLVTSPEFALKRLLAAGSGPVYRLGNVFRAGESGRWHNPEFCMLEWYRTGWGQERLIAEVGDLFAALGVPAPATATYAGVFREAVGLDPHAAEMAALRRAAEADSLAPDGAPDDTAGETVRGFWLDLLMSARVAPALGAERPLVVTGFPACQAGLTRRHPDRPAEALRFEIYWRGVELANGGEELTDADELRRRTAADRAAREAAGEPGPPPDEYLAAAMAHGLPACSGVALGVDRLLALMLGFDRLADVLPFAADRV